MRVGLYLDLRNPPGWRRDWARLYAETLDLVEEAERLGAGSVWVTEHHLFEDGYLPQPLTFAAALAARTRRMRIGTGVLLVPLRPAVQVAEEAAVVDILSEGRLDLGVGAGYRVPEFEAFGVSFAERYRLVGDRVREILRIWDEGLVTPQPIQRPVPIWIGALGPKGARRAGRLGCGLLVLDRRLAESYLEGWRESGRDPAGAQVAGVANMVLADDPEETFRAIAPHIAYQWDSYRRYMVEGTDMPAPRPVDPERWRRPGPRGEPPRFEVLTPDAAAAALRDRLAGLPVADVFLWASVAGMPDHLVRRNVELIATRLAPALAAL